MDARLEQAIARLRGAFPGLLAVYLHGTWGTPDERPDSDVDLAILPAAPVEPAALADAASDLASIFGRDVDLVDLLRAPTVLASVVVSGGDCVFEGDAVARARFEVMVLSSYARLNEERAGILADIARRGTIRA